MYGITSMLFLPFCRLNLFPWTCDDDQCCAWCYLAAIEPASSIECCACLLRTWGLVILIFAFNSEVMTALWTICIVCSILTPLYLLKSKRLLLAYCMHYCHWSYHPSFLLGEGNTLLWLDFYYNNASASILFYDCGAGTAIHLHHYFSPHCPLVWSALWTRHLHANSAAACMHQGSPLIEVWRCWALLAGLRLHF